MPWYSCSAWTAAGIEADTCEYLALYSILTVLAGWTLMNTKCATSVSA